MAFGMLRYLKTLRDTHLGWAPDDFNLLVKKEPVEALCLECDSAIFITKVLKTHTHTQNKFWL